MVKQRLLAAAASAVVLILAAGCSVHKTDVPSLTGPSGLGTNITISVSPDVLNQDGASQSLVTVTATGPTGQPDANLAMRLAVEVNGGITTDPANGSLSALNVVTTANGQATAVFTAPPAVSCTPPCTQADTGRTVLIAATPAGTDFTNEIARTATIRLIPVGIIAAPPSTGITAKFTFSPAAPGDHQPVVFDGSSSTTTNATIVSYQWNFGDGSTGSGITVQHTYISDDDFQVTLTVADNTGRTNTALQTVPVSGVTLQPPAITVSPAANSIVVKQSVFFTSTTTVASNGRQVASYNWNFGDGSSPVSGQSVSHFYSNAGTYTVILTITDDQNHTGSATTTVTVGTGIPIAQITVSPPSAPVNSTVSLIGSQSTAATGRTIVSYAWNFGDGQSGSGATTSHKYTSAGTFTITLIVTDDQGNQGIATASVTITP